MKKTYVLDTNVLLHDPDAIFRFEDNDVVVPIYVIEEVDNFKKEISELGRNAREVSRHIDNLRDRGRLSEGVELREGGKFYIRVTTKELPSHVRIDRKVDSKILAVALDLTETSDDTVVLVTKDTNLRIRADALGVAAEDYESDRVVTDELYTGIYECMVGGSQIDSFFTSKQTSLDVGLAPNQFVMLRSADHEQTTALGRHVKDGVVVPVNRTDRVWGITPRNREQQFAMELLLNDDIKLVSLVGKAGTGKTLLAIAAGLHKVCDENVYSKMIVSRPIFPLGKDLGYLPGDMEEKLNPWMQPIYDNIDFLMNFDAQAKKSGRSHKELFEMGYIQIEALTYIRGRSIPKQYMIVDEAQNLTAHEVKTIVSRAGIGTKIVLTGDPHQIDNPYIDATNNGLTVLVNRFKDQSIAGHITLTKGERSELAEIATQVL